MNRIVVRFSPFFLGLMAVFGLLSSTVLLDWLFDPFGRTIHYDRKGLTACGFISLAVLFLFVFIVPWHKLTIDENGIRRDYRIGLGNLTIWEDKYGNIRWSDIILLDHSSWSIVWGFLLNAEVNGKIRFLIINRFYTHRFEALKIILNHLPSSKISKDASCVIGELKAKGKL